MAKNTLNEHPFNYCPLNYFQLYLINNPNYKIHNYSILNFLLMFCFCKKNYEKMCLHVQSFVPLSTLYYDF